MKVREEKLRTIIEWSEKNEDVRVLLLTSSLVNPLALVDEFSDLDIEFVFEDNTNYISDKSWTLKFGNPIAMIEEDESCFNHKHAMKMLLYEDGVKVDFKLYSKSKFIKETQEKELPEDWDIGYKILIDKDGITKQMLKPTYQISIIKKPSEKEFQNLINDNPKLNIKEETSAKKTRSPPKKAKVEQSVPRKKKLKTDAEKTAEKAQHLRFGKVELTPDELSRLSKAQKREMYAAHAARSAVHREVDQYEDENVGVQALSEGEKAAGNVRDISKSRYARKLKKKAKMQGKKGAKTAKSSAQKPIAAQDAGASGTGEGSSNWLSRWKQCR